MRKHKSYELFKSEVELWRVVTDLAKTKQGPVIALNLPDSSEHESDIRTKVFEKINLQTLSTEDGLDTLIKFLDSELGKDDLTDYINRFDEWENFKRDPTDHKTIQSYISAFDGVYNRLSSKGTKLPLEILCFKLIRKAGCSKEETLAVMSQLDLKKKDTLYESA